MRLPYNCRDSRSDPFRLSKADETCGASFGLPQRSEEDTFFENGPQLKTLLPNPVVIDEKMFVYHDALSSNSR